MTTNAVTSLRRLVALWLVLLVAAGCGAGPTASPTSPSPSVDPLGPWPPSGVPGSPYPTSGPPVDVHVDTGGQTSVVHFGRLAFDVPPAWTYHPMNAYVKTITDAGFIGTADSRAGCFTTRDGMTLSCTFDFRLRRGDVSALLEIQAGPGIITPFTASSLNGNARLIDIGGMAGALEASGPIPGMQRVDRLLTLSVPDPELRFIYRIIGAVRADADGSRMASLTAAFESIRFDPPLVAPSARLADQIALVRGALTALRAANGTAYDCFPETPGTERAARIRRFLGNGFDTRERDVVCRTDLIPDRSGVWLLTLTMLWNNRADHVAATIQVRPDGSIGATSFDGAPPTQ